MEAITDTRVESVYMEKRIFSPSKEFAENARLSSMDEYKKLKEKTGKTIANKLTTFIKSNEYKQLSDIKKKQIIEKTIDKTKSNVKLRMFQDKYKDSKIRSALRKLGVDENDLENAIELYKDEEKRKTFLEELYEKREKK